MATHLTQFILQDDGKYTSAHIIKYTIMIASLPEMVKKRITSHNDFNSKFFNDLKKSKYTKLLFGEFKHSNSYLEKKFKDLKYPILDYTDEFKKEDKLEKIYEYLNLQTTIETLTFG